MKMVIDHRPKKGLLVLESLTSRITDHARTNDYCHVSTEQHTLPLGCETRIRLTYVAFRMLLMVLLTQNSVYMLMKRCCYTNGLLGIQNISVVCSWIFRKITGPVCDETVYSERDYKKVLDLISPVQKVSLRCRTGGVCVAMILRATPLVPFLLVEPLMPDRTRVMTQRDTSVLQAGGWGVRLISI
jgi:hypothetical protein